MSCSVCSDEFPVQPSHGTTASVTCFKCGRQRAIGMNRNIAESTERLHSEPPPIVASDDDWDEIYHPTLSLWEERSAKANPGIQRRFDDESPLTAADGATLNRRTPASGAGRTHRVWQWTMVSMGAATFCCGAALVAWSFTDNQAQLWHVGVPLTLLGQLIFLIGLCLQLDILRTEGQRTGSRIEDLQSSLHQDDEVGLVVSQPSATLARQVHPETALQELKTRLDLVGARLDRC